jgi:hypothetical protein
MVQSKWIDKVVKVSRVNERIMLVKLLIGDDLVNVLSLYAPQVGKTEEEKDCFWDEVCDVLNQIPVSEKIIVAGDLNGHVGRDRSGYERIHGGYSVGARNMEGERILEVAEAMNMIICNSWFQKSENQSITYVSGETRSTVDYILTRVEDKLSVRNVKVIASEACVTQHRLLMADFDVGKANTNTKTKYEPRLKVWKLREEKGKKEFETKLLQMSIGEENVDSKWQNMKDALIKVAKETSGMTRGPPRHTETWWWNEEIAEVVAQKRKAYLLWRKSKSEEDKVRYKN